jgi:hypothetical protein
MRANQTVAVPTQTPYNGDTPRRQQPAPAVRGRRSVWRPATAEARGGATQEDGR